jgi:Protoglobin
MSKMQLIPPTSLTHLPTRIQYLHSFLTFNPSTDGPNITSLKAVLQPLLPHLLDAVYTHLLNYDITARSFLPAQASHPHDGSPAAGPGINETDVTALTLDHANIKHRKDFLRAYLVRLLTNKDWSPESRFWEYLDNVGRVHTGRERTTRKNLLRVEYMHIALLLGWLEDQIVGVVMGLKETEGEEAENVGSWTIERKTEGLRALSKFWWVQNDLFARHYCEDWDLKGEEERRIRWLDRPEVRMAAVGALGVVTGAISVGFLLT